MKVYFKIPDSDSDKQNTLIGLLYENFKLRIELAVQPVKVITDKEPYGMILIERMEETVEIRYEGWTPETELILRWLVAQIKVNQKVPRV